MAKKQPQPGDPFACPTCGRHEWKADYYEAVWQSVNLVVDEDGQPRVEDYTGVYESYDDGSTSDEQFVCRNCGHEIEQATFLIVPWGERVMSANDAINILFDEDVTNAGADWRSGADIAESLAAFFKLTPAVTAELLAKRQHA